MKNNSTKKKIWNVRIPVYAYFDIEVEANTEKEALDLAEEKAENDSSVELQFGDYSDRLDWYAEEVE